MTVDSGLPSLPSKRVDWPGGAGDTPEGGLGFTTRFRSRFLCDSHHPKATNRTPERARRTMRSVARGPLSLPHIRKRSASVLRLNAQSGRPAGCKATSLIVT
ncbi:hypothetical protein PGT21_009224 [Puccinia graminis f. sp. tritici]|uniref:Uncharacterized protein n=1 Tax=Puccinia graminis f. sp. tritici TaxID=56615 RepID=A0A5B0PBZ5_PUCGR|nr:hypothetical protein PGT21_009224 [Puccinia graminis f. sp. tritici]KAA1098633.1 hypothetical protein PGTUg99_005518 [Puccinia graminis f. sp. tritici]